MEILPQKRCSGCGETKPCSDFFKRTGGQDGRQNYCKACSRQKGADLRARTDPLVLSERARRTYQNHRASRIARVAARYRRDPAKAKRRSLEWARRNAEKVRASRVGWARRNPDLIREYCRQRRVMKKGVQSLPISPADLEAKFALWGHRCWVCGGQAEAVDHVKPLSRGGAHLLCNLRPICTACNTRKLNHWPFDTRKPGG